MSKRKAKRPPTSNEMKTLETTSTSAPPSAVTPAPVAASAASPAPVEQAVETPKPSTSSKTSQIKKLGMTSLTPISEALLADKSPKEVLQLILKAAHGITRASTASLMLLIPGTDVLRVEVAEGFKDKKILSTRLRVGQGVTGWVAETGVPLRVGNVLKDPRYVRVQKDLRSELAVPLKIKGRIIGVINCDSTRLNHFSPEDEALLLSLAAHSARVIQTSQLYEETLRRQEELKLLMEAGRVLASTLDFNQVLDKLVAMTARHWKAPLVAAYIPSTDGTQLTVAAVHGGSPEFRQLHSIERSGSLLGKLLDGKAESLVIDDLAAPNTGISEGAREAIRAEGVQSMMIVPLRSLKRPLGVLCVFAAKKKKYDEEQLRLLVGLSNTASMAIENAYFHQRTLASEETLRQAEKSTLMVELAGALAHEIRNPLTSMKILFDAMRNLATFPDEATDDANMIWKQMERLEVIVGQYLESARSHAAVMQAKLLDLNAVVDESLMLLASSAHEGTRMIINLDGNELMTRGDATQLSQAVYNLVLNALQAANTKLPGQERARRCTIDIKSGRTADKKVFFEVADDGPGLSAEVKDRLFQPFVTTKKQGVGLGLSIVKRIVTAHGGKLEIESPRADIGKGARFRVVLAESGS